MISSDEIKREILRNTDTSPLKKQLDKKPSGLADGERIEIGNALESMTKSAGWSIVEQFMLDRMNLVGRILNGGTPIDEGIAKGYIELMQWIDLCIRERNKLLEQERKKYEAKNVPKNEE